MSGNYPWIAGKLRIRRALIESIEQQARTEFPKECCGFLSGPAASPELVESVHPEVNEADKYHKLDPVTFPRTSEMYFKINELRASKAFAQSEQDGHPIKVIYHSHCNAGAYFSGEDAATFARDGELMWPVSFLVVSVVEGDVRDIKLWVHEHGTSRFVESTFEVIP